MTLLTVGYGDVVPVTPGGKVVAMVLMVTGGQAVGTAALCCAVLSWHAACCVSVCSITMTSRLYQASTEYSHESCPSMHVAMPF